MTRILPESIVDILDLQVMGMTVFAHGVTGVAVIVVFAVLMKLFTKQRVMFRFTFIGGIVFFVLWQGARFAYEIYIARFTDLASLYGGFATIMVIVLWVFYSSTLVIMVGEFVQTLQRRFLYGPKWPKAGGKIQARRMDQVERDEERRALLDEDGPNIDPEDISRAIAQGVGLDGDGDDDSDASNGNKPD